MSKKSLDAFTERAIRATDAGKLIPPIVYLPPRLRGHEQRLTIDHVKVTVDPPTIAENHLRIAAADPLGFLIAIMNGQPIPSFHIIPAKEGEPGPSVEVRYEVPTFEQRRETAALLASKVTLRGRDITSGPNRKRPATAAEQRDPHSWDAMVARREAAIRDEANSD